MSVETILLALRVVAGALLLGFLAAIFGVLWRDYRAAARTMAGSKRQHGRLVVIRAHDSAAEAGTAYPLLPVTTLGRGPLNTIVLNDAFASQEHALVSWRGGQWMLEDRSSSNGTLLNREPVLEPVVISSGDVIGIGQVELKLELE